MDKVKAKRAKMDICEIMEDVRKEDFGSPATTEHLTNLADLYRFYDAECLKDEYIDASMRSGMSTSPMSMRDDGMGGIGMENASMRRMRGDNGQYMSGAGSASYAGYAYGGPKEQLRQWMQDPGMSYEAKEYLRKAMESMR